MILESRIILSYIEREGMNAQAIHGYIDNDDFGCIGSFVFLFHPPAVLAPEGHRIKRGQFAKPYAEGPDSLTSQHV